MNLTDTQKHAISEKLNRAIETEAIAPGEAARSLGIMKNYVSMIRNPQLFHSCSKGAWDAANDWYNSGQKLGEYSTAHGRTMVTPEKGREIIQEREQAIIKTRRPRQGCNYSDFLTEAKKEIKDSIRAPTVKPSIPDPGQQFTDTARLKVCLDIEINLVVNGKKVEVK